MRRLLAAFLLCIPTAPVPAACPPPAPKVDAQVLAEEATRARDRGFLWRLERDGRVSWLYGTLHVARLAWIVPGPQVMAAVRAADTLALEIDISDPAVMQRVAAFVRAPAAFVLDAPTRQRLARQMAAACVDSDAFAALRPEFQLSTLGVLVARSAGLHPEFGIDGMLAGIARAAGHPVVSLEEVDSHLDSLERTVVEDPPAFFASGLDELELGHASESAQQVAEIWAQGDLARLEDYPRWCRCMDTPIDRSGMVHLLDERNPGLASRIDALHASGHAVFAAVGSLHMAGTGGLPALLAQRGYAVTRVPLSAP